MQGERSTVESFPETFELDHRSSSSNSGMDQQMYWNIDPIETQNLSDFPASPGDMNIPYANQASQETPNLSIWNSGGLLSIEHVANQGNNGETNMIMGSETEGRQLEATNMLSFESVDINLNSDQVDNGQSFSQSSTANNLSQNSDHNAGHVGTSTQVPDAEQCSHPFNPCSSESLHIPSSGSSSRAVGFVSENGEGRPGGSYDGRRLSCKRKSIEEFPGQYSASGSSSYFHQGENSLFHSHHNTNTSLNISSSSNYLRNPPEEQHNPGIGTTIRLGASDSHPSLSVAGNAESSHRNLRVRLNPRHHDATPPNQWPTGNTVRLPDSWLTVVPGTPSPLLTPFNQSMGTRPVSASGTSESQPHAPMIPGLAQNAQPVPWNGASNLRIGGSSRSLGTAGERLAASREETNSRSTQRNRMLEHLVFAPPTDIRHLVQDPTNWNLANGTLSIPGPVPPPSRSGTSSRGHQSQGPTGLRPYQNPPSQYPRGLSEVVRRPMNPSGVSDPGGQSINFPPLHSSHSATSEEISNQSAALMRGHQQAYVRSALMMDRQSDGVMGVPLPVRTLAAAREGRSRLISEQIRNALHLMRRGENIRFEDILIFDHSVFYGGAADLHDRHRDMRLDVDNMSYEELLALEERIGNVSTGLSEETILKCLKQRKYISLPAETSIEVEPCCICQEEYVEGEELGRLDCGHDFHSPCINQWLKQKNLCPICKTTGLVT